MSKSSNTLLALVLGGAIGAALAFWHLELNKKKPYNKTRDNMKGSYLGPSFSDSQIKHSLNDYVGQYSKFHMLFFYPYIL